jgi:hypothetical protein
MLLYDCLSLLTSYLLGAIPFGFDYRSENR